MTRDELLSLTTPASWDGLSISRLVASAESELLAPIGLTLGSYGSVRMAFKNRDALRQRAWSRSPVPGMEFSIELLPNSLACLASDNGVSLVKECDLEEDYLCSVLGYSCELISKLAPEIHASVRSLLRSLHVLDCPEPGFDLSFSLPDLPFTVFLSIPGPNENDAVPRLAEAIVHEVLHLQLSLVERLSPVVRFGAEPEFAYAPWRDEYRPIEGVIHGLFVFRGVEYLWQMAAREKPSGILEFAERRVAEIRRQRMLVEAKDHASLTRFGNELFNRLADE